MEKYYEEWNGEKFPVRYVWLPEELGGNKAKIADYELWDAICDFCERGDSDAVDIDNTVYFYCDSGFIASDPTDEDILDYLVRHLL